MIIKDKTPFNILVIEDNPGDFMLIKDYLGEQIENPQIFHVWGFIEACTNLKTIKTPYDVILLDLSLPDKNDENLIEEIILLSSGSPVIVLTGYSDIEFSIKSLSMGVADYLLKDDISAASLFKSIRYCIERRKSILLLKESEKRYSDLFRLNPQPMWLCDFETLKFMQVNQAAIDLYGFTKEEFLEMTILDISTHKNNPELAEGFRGNQAQNKSIYKGKSRHFKKSKELMEVEIYSNSVMINDKRYNLVTAIDVTEKNLFEYKITRAIIKTQEDERYEIGAELHDNVCQILATSHMSLGMLKESLDPVAMKSFNQCKGYIELATEEIRNLSHRLNLYRILQEQLRNILKYAKGTEVEVDVAINNAKLKMRISDNGVGFDIHKVKEGIGLANIKRRVELFWGKFEINSSPYNGCEILIEIPLQSAQELNKPLYLFQ